MLLETIKQALTRQVIVDVEARFVNKELITFVEENVKRFPGRAGLKFCIAEPKNQWKVGMYTMESGFEMNDEMAAWLRNRPELEVHVITN